MAEQDFCFQYLFDAADPEIALFFFKTFVFDDVILFKPLQRQKSAVPIRKVDIRSSDAVKNLFCPQDLDTFIIFQFEFFYIAESAYGKSVNNKIVLFCRKKQFIACCEREPVRVTDVIFQTKTNERFRLYRLLKQFFHFCFFS
ncbi:MAG: hypothetical protein IJL26_10705 [Clostridia bacterium]|nr:hypothetical protein [Clostridia bacterium]